MAIRIRRNPWTKLFDRGIRTVTRKTVRAGAKAVSQAIRPAVDKHKPPPGPGDWIAGVAMGSHGALRFRLYRPPGVGSRERLPLMVMLHGCGQDARRFALSTRMNRIAVRERFLVLYPEQDRLANAQGCWNWFETQTGRAYGEAALIMKAIDQTCSLYPVDRQRVAVAGLSAGASMAALLAARHPDRFRAVVMHSGVPPGTAHSALSAIGAMHGRRPTVPLDRAHGWPPLLVIHGKADPVVNVGNGHTAAAVWAEAAGARARPPRSVQRGSRYPMVVSDYLRSGRKLVTLAVVERLGHAWSGGAASEGHGDVKGPDASRLVWAFAARQFDLASRA